MKTFVRAASSSAVAGGRYTPPSTKRPRGDLLAVTHAYSRHRYSVPQMGGAGIILDIRQAAHMAPANPRKSGKQFVLSLSDKIKRMGLSRFRAASRYSRPDQIRLLARRQRADAIYSIQKEKIRSFARLPKGWNSYSAEAPDEQAIDLALRFADLVEKHGVKIAWLAPSVDDSVMMTVDAPSGKQEWEFFGNGGTAVMYRGGDGEKSYIDLEEAEFERFLTR